jgi:hypothetical protein
VTVQDVQEAIVKPMLRLYMAPGHLRENPHEQPAALQEYFRSLEHYPRPVLEQVWRVVVEEHTLSIWPPPGKILEICRRVPRSSPKTNEVDQRLQQARDLAETYAQRFMKTSQVARLAKREGWSGYLRSYVEAASWVQAQLIGGIRDIGFDSILTRHLGTFASAQEALQAYRRTLPKSLDKGQIRVTVPKSLVSQWQTQHSDSTPQKSNSPKR